MKYLYVAYYYLATAYTVLWESRRATTRALNELASSGIPRSSLDAERIHSYVVQSLISAQWAVAMRGYGSDRREKENLRWLGALTPLLDDLTDREGKTSSTFFDNDTNKQSPVSFLYHSLMAHASHEFKQAFDQALAAQDASLLQQSKEPVPVDALKELTARKGGTAMWLYRLASTNTAKPGELEAFHSLGYVLQLTNDLFDVYKDLQAGQQTVVTNCTDLSVLRTSYEGAVSDMLHRFTQLDYPRHRIRKCLLLISTVISRGEVCLAQLERLAPSGTRWDPRKYTRKELVCDMERLDNLMASFKFSVAFYERLRRLKTA